MIVVGVLAAALLTVPGVLPAVGVVLLIQLQILLDCSDGELARWREQYSPVGIYLDRFGHYLTETLLPIGARHPRRRRLGLDRRLHDARAARRGARAARADRERARARSRALESGKPPPRTPPRSPRRARRGCAAAARARLLPVLPRLRGDRGDAARAGRRDRRRVRRRRARATRALSSRWCRSRRSPRPATWSPSSRRAGCGDVRVRPADDGPPAGRAAAGARVAAAPSAGVELDIVVVGNAWEPAGLPEACAASLGREPRHPGGAQPRRPARRRASCCSSSTTTPASPRRTRWRAVARRFEADPALGLLQLRVAPRDGGARARDWVPRLRVGDRARSSDITAVWEGAVAMRRSVFEAVGGWPADFRFVHEGIDLGMAGDGRRLARRLRRRHRRAAPVADRHAARLLLLLRGAQPGLAGPPPPPAPARRRSTSRLRAADAAAAALGARRARGAARVPRRAARPGRRRKPLKARAPCGG